MNKTLKAVLVAVGITAAGIANAGSMDTSSYGAIVGSCQAIVSQFAGPNADINALRTAFQRKGQRLQGQDKIQFNAAYNAALQKPAQQADLSSCARWMDAN